MDSFQRRSSVSIELCLDLSITCDSNVSSGTVGARRRLFASASSSFIRHRRHRHHQRLGLTRFTSFIVTNSQMVRTSVCRHRRIQIQMNTEIHEPTNEKTTRARLRRRARDRRSKPPLSSKKCSVCAPETRNKARAHCRRFTSSASAAYAPACAFNVGETER